MRIGHSPAHLDDADTFVYTTAINPRHEEFVAARASGKPVLRRAAALAAALEDKRTVAVAGTHGKTSTTSLLVVAAQACGVDPSFAIGGNLYESGTQRPPRHRRRSPSSRPTRATARSC